MTQLLLTPEDAALSLAVSRSRMYELLRSGDVHSVKIGRSRRVPTEALEDYVTRLRGTSSAPVGAALSSSAA